jgi:hypothetical protein
VELGVAIGVGVKMVVGAGVAEYVEAEEVDIEDEAVIGQMKVMTVEEWLTLASADNKGTTIQSLSKIY